MVDEELVEVRKRADPADAEESGRWARPDPRDERLELPALRQPRPASLGEPLERAGKDQAWAGNEIVLTQREVGDVLVTFENEVALLKAEFGDKFDVVYPSLSIEAAPPVAVNTIVTAKRGTAELAKGYLDFLYTTEGQKIIAKQGFRPRDTAVLAAANLPEIKTFRVEDKIGSWAETQKKHFADGGIYDQITTPTTKSN